MKCKTCNGLGRTKATEFVGVDEGLRDVVILCPTCGGKGEVESLTEQEYIQTCTTEQLAEWIYQERWTHSDGWYELCGHTVKEVVEWLKQPHTIKE